MRIETLTFESDVSQRVDSFLSSSLNISRSSIAKLIEDGIIERKV